MKEWFTNAELASLALPLIPDSESGVARWFKSRDIDANFPAKVRRRAGRGGGTERHYTLLPQGAQSQLLVRALKTNLTPDDAPPATAPEPDTGQPLPPRATVERDAKLAILSLWEVFRAKHNGPVETARHLFCVMYTNRKIEGLPDWVIETRRNAKGKPKGLSVNTLRNWEKARDKGRLSDLAGGYGNRKGTGVLDRAENGRVARFIAALIIRQPRLTGGDLRDQVRAEFGDRLVVDNKTIAVPPLRTFQRFASQWKSQHAEALLKATDPDRWRSTMRFSGSNMNHWVTRPNQLWEIDASPADALCINGRHSIYIVTDIATRRQLGLVSKTANTEAVLSLLRKAILTWGVPEELRIDNGSDFKSHRSLGAFASLGIRVDTTEAFSPDQKGTVERGIGTVQRGLMTLLPGFIGHSVADRKSIEARKSFAQRLGESAGDAFCVELTGDQLQGRMDEWLDLKYQHNPHAGLGGKTPFEAAAESTAPIKRIENERALDLLLAVIPDGGGIRTVTKRGIRVDNAHFIHPDMVPRARVLCRHDPADWGRLYCFEPGGEEFLFVAECPERLGIDPGDAIRRVRAAQAARIKTELDPLRREIRSMKPGDLIDNALDVARRDHGSLTAFPKQAETHDTPALAAAEAANAPAAGPRPLSDAENAQADAAFAAASDPTVVDLAVRPGERPVFRRDEEFARWVMDNPDAATADDRDHLSRLLESKSFRLLMGVEETRTA